MTAIKFCGLTRVDDARNVERAGARYLGVILASGPRLIDTSRANVVLGARRAGIERGAVFGDQPLDEVLRIAALLDLDLLQLHGDPTAEFVGELRARTDRAIWPVLRVDGTTLPTRARALAEAAGTIVLDTKVIGQLGGTGVTLDWVGLRDAVHALRAAVPSARIVLAGGLRAHNVAEAIALLRPDVVDVSSGVESAPGVKDAQAITQFVAAVKAAKET